MFEIILSNIGFFRDFGGETARSKAFLTIRNWPSIHSFSIIISTKNMNRTKSFFLESPNINQWKKRFVWRCHHVNPAVPVKEPHLISMPGRRHSVKHIDELMRARDPVTWHRAQRCMSYWMPLENCMHACVCVYILSHTHTFRAMVFTLFGWISTTGPEAQLWFADYIWYLLSLVSDTA